MDLNTAVTVHLRTLPEVIVVNDFAYLKLDSLVIHLPGRGRDALIALLHLQNALSAAYSELDATLTVKAEV